MKKQWMVVFGLAAVLGFSGTAIASPKCTTEPQDKWMKKEDFEKKVKADGYTIKKFKTTEHCYEIYGKKDGKKVEVYFNPVDGSVVKSK